MKKSILTLFVMLVTLGFATQGFSIGPKKYSCTVGGVTKNYVCCKLKTQNATVWLGGTACPVAQSGNRDLIRPAIGCTLNTNVYELYGTTFKDSNKTVKNHCVSI